MYFTAALHTQSHIISCKILSGIETFQAHEKFESEIFFTCEIQEFFMIWRARSSY